MGASVGTNSKGSVDVELNVVPFIDLLSCLTAFLLVTAVWTNLAQINIKPKGIGRDAEKVLQEEIPVNASILITQNEMWVGLTTGDRRQIKKETDKHDWAGLEQVLKEFDQMPVFAGRDDIEIGAEDDVVYQDIVSAMDSAIATGFRDVGFVDPNSLSVRFKE
jgi:biopolymer transport protein ExbD